MTGKHRSLKSARMTSPQNKKSNAFDTATDSGWHPGNGYSNGTGSPAISQAGTYLDIAGDGSEDSRCTGQPAHALGGTPFPEVIQAPTNNPTAVTARHAQRCAANRELSQVT